MRKSLILLVLSACAAQSAHANAVAIVDGQLGTYLTLVASRVEADVESQIATVTTTQLFRNDLGADTTIKYAFPLPEKASAVGIRWELAGQWYEASISPTPQDTTVPGSTPGGEANADLVTYLGGTPMYVEIEQTIPADSTISTELRYVELLPYQFGSVDFRCPNDYRLIQPEMVDMQELSFALASPRTITGVDLLSGHAVTSSTNSGLSALLEAETFEVAADEDYHVQYSLSLDELGLFGFSTSLPDSEVPDDLGGFFLFIAEPDPGPGTGTIDKVFTLIVDRSGSMGGDKIVQARDAAEFIVSNLNPGDKFNIIDYASDVTSFRSSHVDYDATTEQAAIEYIRGLQATGSTNMVGSLDLAIPQFGVASDSTANIIVFFTDGRANVGISDTPGMVAHVQQLVAQNETMVSLFTFGIGSAVNTQLLTMLATQNGGLAEFLGDDELADRIMAFYTRVRDPVMLISKMEFSSPTITDVYPDPMPNLYKGQQLIVSGRYTEPVPMTVTLSGTASGTPVSHDYALTLVDSSVAGHQFLLKVWAKQKIEHLMVEYYLLGPGTSEAELVEQAIMDLSIAYGVVTPLTSFEAPSAPVPGSTPDVLHSTPGVAAGIESMDGAPEAFELLGNSPNPFNPTTVIRFTVGVDLGRLVAVRIYDEAGQLIATLTVTVRGPGLYEVRWGGLTRTGAAAASGSYVYVVDFGDVLLAGRMQLVR